MLHAYVVEFLRRNPTTNTYLGGAGLDPSLRDVDGMLRDYSATALEDEDRWLTDTPKALEAIDPAGAVGRTRGSIARSRSRRSGSCCASIRCGKYQERALDTYVGEPFRALDWQLQGMTQTGDKTYGTAEEWTLVVNRVRAIPRYLATAQAQLEIGVKAEPRAGSADARARRPRTRREANAKYFGETLPALAERAHRRRRSRAQPDRAARRRARRAAAAYREFRDFIATTFFDGGVHEGEGRVRRRSLRDGRRGIQLGDRRTTSGSTRPAAQLFDEAWPIVQATQTQMVDLARKIGAAAQLEAAGRRSGRGARGLRRAVEGLSEVRRRR